MFDYPLRILFWFEFVSSGFVAWFSLIVSFCFGCTGWLVCFAFVGLVLILLVRAVLFGFAWLVGYFGFCLVLVTLV